MSGRRNGRGRTPRVRDTVVDSYALLAFLRGEKGSSAVTELLEAALRAGRRVAISSVNWAEVKYMVQRKMGTASWQAVREKLLGLPLDVVPVDRALAEEAATLKAIRKMSLADCFAAALAMSRQADLYTGDPEFREVERQIRIVWI